MRKKINQKALVVLIGFMMMLSASLFVFPIRAFQKPKTSQVTLTIVVTDQQMPGVKNVTDAFLASSLGTGVTSVTVVSSGTTANDQLTFLETLMAGGTATSHVIGLDVVWTALFADNGWIIDLTDHLDANELDAYGSGIVAAGMYQDKPYAYPYFMNLGILFYRTDLMDRFYGAGGWSEADFDTWEELKTVANYILNNGSGKLLRSEADLVGYVGQFDAYEGGVVNFFEWCGSNGVLDVVTSTGEVNADTDDVNDAMQYLKDLVPGQYTGVQGNLTVFNATGPTGDPNTGYNNYIIPRDGLVHDEGSSVGKWLAGESIFMRQWPFAYGLSSDMDFGIAPLPHFAGATGYKTSVVGGAILAVPSATTGDARDAAVNLIKYLGDQVAQETELTADTDPGPKYAPLSNFPALLSVFANPPAGFEWIKNWTDQAALTLSRPIHPDYPIISDTIADYFSDLLSCQKSVNDSLFEMERDLKEIVIGPPSEPIIPGYSIAIIIISIASVVGIVIIAKKKFR